MSSKVVVNSKESAMPGRSEPSERLRLDRIRLDGGTQPRAGVYPNWVRDYAEQMAAGAAFPPLVVFFDGTFYWLADGFHRYWAAETLGLAEIPCDVRQGTRRDAVLHSVGANAGHGHRRTNDDKRRVVHTMLDDPEWSRFSDRKIAELCAVSQQFVTNLRAERRQRPASDNG